MSYTLIFKNCTLQLDKKDLIHLNYFKNYFNNEKYLESQNIFDFTNIENITYQGFMYLLNIINNQDFVYRSQYDNEINFFDCDKINKDIKFDINEYQDVIEYNYISNSFPSKSKLLKELELKSKLAINFTYDDASLIVENNGISYINIFKHNRKIILYIYNAALIKKNLKIIEYIDENCELSVEDYEHILETAVYYGNKDVVLNLIKKGIKRNFDYSIKFTNKMFIRSNQKPYEEYYITITDDHKEILKFLSTV